MLNIWIIGQKKGNPWKCGSERTTVSKEEPLASRRVFEGKNAHLHRTHKVNVIVWGGNQPDLGYGSDQDISGSRDKWNLIISRLETGQTCKIESRMKLKVFWTQTNRKKFFGNTWFKCTYLKHRSEPGFLFKKKTLAEAPSLGKEAEKSCCCWLWLM